MNTEAKADRSEELWGWVEGERRLDRRVRHISRIAWAVTFIAVVLYGLIVLARVSLVLSELARHNAPRGTTLNIVFDTLLPLIVVLGVLGLLVAVLSTIVIFLRFRTASLAEIKARLAALEEVILNESSRS